MAEAGLLLNRALDDSKVHPDKLGAPLVLGEIAYVAWVSAANPTLETSTQARPSSPAPADKAAR